MRYRVLLIVFLVSILLAACTLREKETPLPTSSNQESQPEIITVVLPVVKPDAESGAPIYVQKCAECHGITGRGDGIRASRLTLSVPAIGTAELARRARPTDWFGVISTGRVERSMPAFNNSLDDRSRWDVLAYLYLFSLTDSMRANGTRIYHQECQSCHGQTGSGDGPATTELNVTLPDWSNPAQLAQHSGLDLYTSLTNGIPPAMPNFEDSLSEEERWEVAGYIQSLLFLLPKKEIILEAVPTPTVVRDIPIIEGETGIISGGVINATNGNVPDRMEVTLNGFINHDMVTTNVVYLDSNHSFRFIDVPLGDDLIYVVSVQYGGYTFTSDIISGEDLKPDVAYNLPVVIYEVTTDSSQIWADRMHVFLDKRSENTIQIVEMFLLNNPTDRLVVGEQPGEPVITYKLPPGATNLVFDSGELGERFISVEEGFADTQGILPGGGYQVMFGYNLPFTDQESISINVPVPVNNVVVMAPKGELMINGNQLAPGEDQQIQDMNLVVYTASDLSKNEALELIVSNQPSEAPYGRFGSKNNLVIGIVVLSLVLISVGLWLSWMQLKNRKASQEAFEKGLPSADAVLDQIIALDDQFQAGNMTRENYLQRRVELKNKLREIDEKTSIQDAG